MSNPLQTDARCANADCGRPLQRQQVGRKRRYCNDRCRDQARSQRNAASTGHTRRRRFVGTKPRNGTDVPDTVKLADSAKNSAADSAACVPTKSISKMPSLDWEPVNEVIWKLC